MNGSDTNEASFTDDAAGWARRLAQEFDAARKALKEWHAEAQEAIAAYNGTKDAGQAGMSLNVYNADTQTQEAILFGNPPRTTVTRRFADAQDDVARVAGEIQERLLNADIEGEDDTFSQAVSYAHWERQVPGFGLCRVRYVMGEVEKVPGKPAIPHPTMPGVEMAPAIPDMERRPNEAVETDWVHWQDVLWNPCRVWHEVTWLAFGTDVSRRQAAEKFGEETAATLPAKNRPGNEDKAASPWDRIRLWEVWMKEERQVFFYVEGVGQVLAPVGVEVAENGGIPDPLGLEGFFPCPRPLIANLTTSRLVPKPDYALAKELYRDVNELAGRIRMLESAVKVRGAYDKSNQGLRQVMDGEGNGLVPVDNWALLAERGGLQGAISWLPIEQVVAALQVLQGRLVEKQDMLRQLTGMSDIMRGQASSEGATATEQRIKARFGSVRMERRQKELARFVSDLQRLRAEVMAKHFDESTYLARCNCERTPDANLAQQAVQLLKSGLSKYRIEVKPETISMTDFDALKQERTEVIAAVSQYLTAAAPLGQQVPAAGPGLLQILQWMVSGLRGASEIEGVLDSMIAQAQQAAQAAAAAPQAQQPDPKLMAQQLKSQTDLEKVDRELQADLIRLQAETAAQAQQERTQAIENTREAAMKAQITKAFGAAKPNPGGGVP